MKVFMILIPNFVDCFNGEKERKGEREIESQRETGVGDKRKWKGRNRREGERNIEGKEGWRNNRGRRRVGKE